MKRQNSDSEQPAKKQKNSNISDNSSLPGKLTAIPSPAEIQKRLEAAKAQVLKSLPTKSEQVIFVILTVETTGYEICIGS